MSLKKIFPAVLFIIFLASESSPQNTRKLEIEGLRIFNTEKLFKELRLERFERGEIDLPEVISSIEKFYRERGYSRIKIFPTDTIKGNRFVLFVDEGRIGRIIVHNLNNYYSLKFKQQVKIPKRIYNDIVISENLMRLIDKFPNAEITLEVLPPPDYDGNIIQLNRELERLRLGEIIDLNFFESYIPKYDLHFHVENKGTGNGGGHLWGFGFDINYRFPSIFIPRLSYYDDNLFFGKDYFESSASIGLDPGFSGLINIHPTNTLNIPPRINFIELTGEYKVSPMENDLIGPLLRGRFFLSRSGRKDIGIEEYSKFVIRETLAPEITLLKNFNIYAGFGLEQVRIFKSNIDPDADRVYQADEEFYKDAFSEIRLKFDPIPIRIGNRIDKFILLTYTDYFTGNSSNMLELLIAYDTEFRNLSILSLRGKGFVLFDNPPFYMCENVNNQYFRGFPGKSYYTDKKFSASAEYRFSIYQDYLYAGGFVEWVTFNPVGYKISGTKKGINAGPTARVLIYDQFEFSVYFGFDRLYPDNTRGTNLQMKLTKKW